METDKRSRHFIPFAGYAGGGSGDDEGNDIPGVDLKEAGRLLGEGRVKDAVFRIFLIARALVDRRQVLTDGQGRRSVDDLVWDEVVRTRTVHYPDTDEKRNPYGLECYHQLRIRNLTEMRKNWEEISTGNVFALVRKRYLAGYRRALVKLQGGKNAAPNPDIRGTYLSGAYFRKKVLQGQNLWQDSILLSAGRVTVVNSIMGFLCAVREEEFKKRERAVAVALREETDGFPDERIVRKAILKKGVPRVMKEFDEEMAVSLVRLQKAVLGALRKAEEEAGNED